MRIIGLAALLGCAAAFAQENEIPAATLAPVEVQGIFVAPNSSLGLDVPAAVGSNGASVSRDGNVPTGVPERMANLWSTWRFAPRWKIGAGVRYVGKRPTNSANSAWLPSYTLVDTVLTYEYSRSLSVQLAVKNLTNRNYAVSGSDGDWLLGAPRTVMLTTRATF